MKIIHDSDRGERAKLASERLLDARPTQEPNPGEKGTILAQIAITALQLDHARQTHWSARMFWVWTLVLALVSVWYSGRQLKVIGRLMHPAQIRKWVAYRDTSEDASGLSEKELPLPSFIAVVLVVCPGIMLGTAVHCFMVGLGVYLGSYWSRKLGVETAGEDLNVFIAFIVGLVLSYLENVQIERQHVRHGGHYVFETTVRMALERQTLHLEQRVGNGPRTSQPPAPGRHGPDEAGSQAKSALSELRDAAIKFEECARAQEQVARQFRELLTGLAGGLGHSPGEAPEGRVVPK
jgi:hypothetical protein